MRDPACPPDPFANADKYPGVQIGARGRTVGVGSYYGEPTGIVGLRLFPNPAFDAEARGKWDSERYYRDPSYYESRDLVKPYRRAHGNDCIVPFSGGRDSCYGLHLVVNELKMKPVTYTYDWGMVTDLGRRNISRMCAELGVENIIVADDIQKKRDNIRKNLKAWLKRPDLGMINIHLALEPHIGAPIIARAPTTRTSTRDPPAASRR